MRGFAILVVVAIGTAAGVAPGAPGDGTQAPRAYKLGEAPPSYAPAIERAQAAFTKFHNVLLRRVSEELTRGGALQAIRVYRDEAATLVAQIARDDRIRMGRTSHRLRNFRNRPPEWAAPYVTESAAGDWTLSTTWVVEMGSAIGVVAPLEASDTCLICHGRPQDLSAELAGAIRAAYPGDRATGFARGQVRGWVWAEVPKQPR